MKFEYVIDEDNYLIAECTNPRLDDTDLSKGLEHIGEAYFNLYSNENKRPVGNFRFSHMPGCCGMVVSHNTFLNRDFRGTMVSDGFRKLKEELAKELGYTMMIATTRMRDEPAVGNFRKSGYEIVRKFVNKRTNNELGIGLKCLT